MKYSFLVVVVVVVAAALTYALIGEKSSVQGAFSRDSDPASQQITVPTLDKLNDRSGERHSVSQVEVYVIDAATELPLEGAEIRVGESTIGLTNTVGRWRANSAADVQHFRVTCEGYEEHSVNDVLIDSQTIVQLVASETLHGYVVAPIGAPADLSGVTVHAWRQDSNRGSTPDMRAAKSEDHYVQCDSKGRFEFPTIHSTEGVNLVAGGDDMISRVIKEAGATVHDQLIIDLDWLSGGVAQLVGSNGQPVKVSRRNTMPGGWGVTLPNGAGLEMISAADPAVALNGWVGPEVIDDGLSSFEFLFRSKAPQEGLAGLRFSARFPGYERLETEVKIARLSEGFVVQSLALQALVIEFTDLKIDFKAVLKDLATEPSTLYSPATIKLRRQGASGSYFFHFFPADCDKPLTLIQVPSGVYTGSITWVDGTKIALISPDGRREFDVVGDASMITHESVYTGSIEVMVLSQGGQPYEGPCTISYGLVKKDSMRASNQVNFSGPPFTIYVAKLGEYAGAVTAPSSADLVHGGSFVFQVSKEKPAQVQARLIQ